MDYQNFLNKMFQRKRRKRSMVIPFASDLLEEEEYSDGFPQVDILAKE